MSDDKPKEADLMISHKDPWYYSLIQGYSGGLITVVVGHPFETLKVRVQTQATGNMFKNLYYGITPPLLFTSFGWSINFWAYQRSLQLVNAFSKDGITEANVLAKVYTAGAISGIAWASYITPVELIRNYSQRYHMKASQSVMNIYNKFGAFNTFRLMYRGWIACLIRDIPLCFFYFGQVEVNRRYLPGYGKNLFMQFVAGCLVGVVAWVPCMPFDMVKSNIQTEFARFAHENVDAKKNIENIPSSKWLVNFKKIMARHDNKFFNLWNGTKWMVGRNVVCSGIMIIWQEYMLNNILRPKDDEEDLLE